ncbi:hypothetical protein [Polaromonas sp. CG_23.6]|uniref:hypothetical protein n=1 Tax=Polaromonas sp. CG_23.6 TaxID=2760709 RepID=UPI002473D5C0|nr:hypothetical protein [Polaromonas sp. CG_23.6]MDH6185518.1 hypothetical protein [Polaromonas sp. CG_23.6]
MNNEQVTALALANGFKLKTQPDGAEALNLYVFDFARAVIAAHESQRQDAETWSLYIASMVEAYLQSQPAADKREAAIFGIISRRLWALPDRAQRQAGQLAACWIDTNDLKQMQDKGRGIVCKRPQDGYEQTALYAAPQPVQADKDADYWLRQFTTSRQAEFELRRELDDKNTEIAALKALLNEVRCSFTRDDDLPDDLLPRIDEALQAQAVKL